MKVLGMLSMANLEPAFRTAARLTGITLLLPRPTKRTLDLGVRYSPETICLPFKVILGTFIECLEQGADTLFMIKSSNNACRMGYYHFLQEAILRDLGFKFEFLRYKAERKNIFSVLKAIKEYTNNSSWRTVIKAYQLGTTKLKIFDNLERKLHFLRPRVKDKARLEQIAKEAIEEIAETLDVTTAKKMGERYFQEMDKIPWDSNTKPLKVMVIGEIYAVMEPFTNMEIEKELGWLGCEVKRTRSTFFSEYLSPLNYIGALDKEKERLRRFAFPFLRRDISAHGLESVGEIASSSGRFDGVIHLAPFSCLPEVVARNIMKAMKNGVPVLSISLDEQLAKTNLMTRLEAFVDLMGGMRKRKGEKFDS